MSFFSEDGKFNFQIIKNISQFEMSEKLNFIQKINKEDFKKNEKKCLLNTKKLNYRLS